MIKFSVYLNRHVFGMRNDRCRPGSCSLMYNETFASDDDNFILLSCNVLNSLFIIKLSKS